MIATCLTIIYIIWWIISRKEQVSVDGSNIGKALYRMSQYLYKRLCISKITFPQHTRVRKNLEKLYPGEPVEQKVTEYYVKKTALTLGILLIGTLFSTVLKFQTDTGRILEETGIISRGNYRDGSKNISLEASLGEKYRGEFRIEIMAKTLNKKEAEDLLMKFWEEISIQVLEENMDSEHISSDLNLAEEWEGYPFRVEWQSSMPEIVSRSGVVANVQEPDKVLLTALIRYENWQWVRELSIIVRAPELTEEELLEVEIKELLQNAEKQYREEEQWSLPDMVQGQKIRWKEKTENSSLVFWVLTVFCAAGIFFLSDKDLHDGVEKKKAQMKDAYPVIVNKMALYLGAGMTVRGAFCKIAEKYQDDVNQGGRLQPAYNEMLHTCRELQAGVSEGTAYEHFGRRSGLQEYIRLAALLSQNLKKGNSALLSRLREETAIAMEERIHRRKQAGEEASTKLLVPMMMMLALVMIFIMIPAFSSFGM